MPAFEATLAKRRASGENLRHRTAK